MSCCALSLLHLARNSSTERAGVSSIKIGALERRSSLLCICCHSCGSKVPFLSFSESISASAEIIRSISWLHDISKEKMATGMLKSMAAFRIEETTNAVFPMAGRAAIITNSVFCHPPVIRSNAVNPLATPVSPSLLFFLDSSSAMVCRRIELASR